MGLVSLIRSKIDFLKDRIFESAARFFVIILKLIFTTIFEIKFTKENSLTPKNFIFEGRFLLNNTFIVKVNQSPF